MNAQSSMIAAGFAFLTVVVASPPPASANFKRQHASSCMEDSVTPQAVFQEQFLVNNSSQLADNFVCGLAEDTAIRKDKVVKLNLTGLDQTTAGQIVARACIGFSSGTGGQCDPTVNNGAPSVTGAFTIAVPHASWDFAHKLDYAYVQISVPAAQAALRSGISGLFIADVNG